VTVSSRGVRSRSSTAGHGVPPSGAPGARTSESSALAFGEKLLAILETGSFTTSYKYAVLLAIFDATLETTGPEGQPPSVLHARDLGRRVFERYWWQARPFGERGPLRQSGQRDLIVKIAELRHELRLPEHISVDAARARHPDVVGQLEREVVATVVRYPVVLLQRFGTGSGAVDDRFIYDVSWTDHIGPSTVHAEGFDDRLPLRPGAGGHLASIAGLARPVVEREWLRHVARRNGDQVEELQLESYLFGGRRVGLDAVREPLLELQTGRCFYCDGERGPWDVDHFLPWSRLADDRLDNLVVAHRRCNNDKRASLAALGHLERWWRRSRPGGAADRRLDGIAHRLTWPRHVERTAAAARGLYLHQPSGTMLWRGRGEVEPLDPDHLGAILAERSSVAAEDSADYGGS
jgi:5-methylcytosine-specific restriction endonuclease McrA